ncbi:IS110 family transposase [Acetobacter senegalensis]|uniref:IS110 family transposase n=1 Tax=Acetobacter senegalensis TaxID=446692 RepID=UPI000A77A7F9|nr:transposase [Acetobacter senegalensis]
MAQTCAKQESNAVVVGIDVSKDHLDAAQYPSGDLIQTSNDTKGLRTLLRWIGRQRAAHVVFEATGPFHRQLESHLAKAGIPFSWVNPRHARKFAEATKKLAKTDRVDAVMLARMGHFSNPGPGGIEEPLIGSFLRVACWFVDLIFTLRFEQSESLMLWIATLRR